MTPQCDDRVILVYKMMGVRNDVQTRVDRRHTHIYHPLST